MKSISTRRLRVVVPALAMGGALAAANAVAAPAPDTPGELFPDDIPSKRRRFLCFLFFVLHAT
jgi:hypothetical protein